MCDYVKPFAYMHKGIPYAFMLTKLMELEIYIWAECLSTIRTTYTRAVMTLVSQADSFEQTEITFDGTNKVYLL